MERSSARPQVVGTRPPRWRGPSSSSDSYDCPLVVFLIRSIGLPETRFCAAPCLGCHAETGPLSNAPLKETCDLRLSGVSAGYPMTHEFLHDARSVPLSVRPVAKSFPGPD